MTKPEGYHWLPAKEYDALIGHALRVIWLGAYEVKLDKYGQEPSLRILIDRVCKKALDDFGMAVRGKDQPIELPDDIKRSIEARVNDRYNADD